MAVFTKLTAIVISAFVLCASTPSARADAVFVTLDGSDKSVKPSDYGYKIDMFTVNRHVIIQIVLTEDATKQFGHGDLALTKDGEAVVETTLGLDDGGAKRGLLKITLDPQAIDGGELTIWSGPINEKPSFPNFGGFRLSIKTLLAHAKEAGGR